jgi:outer membrane receptor protein involved in Fe transport
LDVAPRPEPNGAPGYERTLADYAAELGASYELGHGIAIMVKGGRGFRSPNVDDLSAIGSRRQGRYQVPNPDLLPEHSYTADLGVKATRGALILQTAVFVARYADAIVLGPTSLGGQPTSLDGDAYYHSVNAARVDYQGVELRFSLPVHSRFAVFGRWLSMLGTQYGGEESDLPSETPADRVPPRQGELGVSANISPKLSAELFGSFRAAQQRLNDPTNLEDNRIAEGGTPGYVTLHARGTYVASSQLRFRLALYKLEDELDL